jgi:hypothetical protein
MAKISLKNYDELIVTQAEAERVCLDKEKDQELHLPYTITHQDGIWIGTLRDIGPISLSEVKKRTHYLKHEDIERFHITHGYGKYKTEHIRGYGLLDVPTQYMIGTGQAKLKTDSSGRTSLVVLKQNEATTKWAELWQDYLTKLDPFNELRQQDNPVYN